jgi:hypothetical protein
MSSSVMAGKSGPQGRPVAGLVVFGPVVPNEEPSMLLQTMKKRSVSSGRPGPSSGAHELSATWWPGTSMEGPLV